MMRLKNKIKYLNKREGFTLIEILAVIALSGLIMTVALNVFSSGINSFFNAEEKADFQRNLRFLENYISRSIRNAEDIRIADSFISPTPSLSTGEKIIGIENSFLKYREKGGATKELIDLSKASGIEFITNSSDEPYSLIIEINGQKFSEIILNNSKFLVDNKRGSVIIFK